MASLYRSWSRERAISTEVWSRIVEDTKRVFAVAEIPLEAGDGDTGPPVADAEKIEFDGVGDAGFEGFGLERGDEDCGQLIDTNDRPYDVVVAAVLLIARYRAPSDVTNLRASEDGDGPVRSWEELWQPAVDLCGRAGVTFPAAWLEEATRSAEQQQLTRQPLPALELAFADDEEIRPCPCGYAGDPDLVMLSADTASGQTGVTCVDVLRCVRDSLFPPPPSAGANDAPPSQPRVLRNVFADHLVFDGFDYMTADGELWSRKQTARRDCPTLFVRCKGDRQR